jgi:hypothetical protein
MSETAVEAAPAAAPACVDTTTDGGNDFHFKPQDWQIVVLGRGTRDGTPHTVYNFMQKSENAVAALCTLATQYLKEDCHWHKEVVIYQPYDESVTTASLGSLHKRIADIMRADAGDLLRIFAEAETR